jgi:hypothetical protein
MGRVYWLLRGMKFQFGISYGCRPQQHNRTENAAILAWLNPRSRTRFMPHSANN